MNTKLKACKTTLEEHHQTHTYEKCIIASQTKPEERLSRRYSEPTTRKQLPPLQANTAGRMRVLRLPLL